MHALAGVALFQYHPIDQKFVGLIPGLGTYPGCTFDSSSGHISQEGSQYLSLTLMFLSLSLPSSLSKNNGEKKSSGEDKKIERKNV